MTDSVDFDDLIGFRPIRIRTYGEFLLKLVILRPGATKMLTSPDTWYFNQKIEESKLGVSYELASIFDVEGLSIPKRRLYTNFCPFAYRGPDCKYAGPDVPTNGEPDGALETLDACQQHFGAGQTT